MQDQYIYLFIVDLISVAFKSEYSEYEKREPGYGTDMLKAYTHAFNAPKTEPLNEKLIKEIHKIAMGFDKTVNSGEYKKETNFFKTFPYITQHTATQNWAWRPSYTASKDGLKELVEYWFIKAPKNPLRLYCLNSRTPPQGLMLEKGQCTIMSKDTKKKEDLDFDKHWKEIEPIFHATDKETYVYSFSNNKPDECLQLMNTLINTYNKEIKNARTNTEKMTAIITFIQRVEQLHPFLDGNLRTCYILLNKLLSDNGLSPTLLMNPNRFDCCSFAELFTMVERGQKHFKQVIAHTNGDLILSAPNETDPDLREFVCPGSALINVSTDDKNAFIQSVINHYKTNETSIQQNSNTFFTNDLSSKRITHLLFELQELVCTDKKLLDELANGMVNRALRIACAEEDNPKIIIKILEYKDDLSINPNEKSSNGNNAIMWLESNKKISSTQKEDIRKILTATTTEFSQKHPTG